MRDSGSQPIQPVRQVYAGDPDHSSKGGHELRLTDSLIFTSVILSLGAWITAFLLMKDGLFSRLGSGILSTDLACITFFGGLLAAILVGAAIGNLLHRTSWKNRFRRRK